MIENTLQDSARPRKSRPVRSMAARAAERRMPKMHWRWCKRGRDIVALLDSRFGSALPDDDAGMDAVKLLAVHYMGLKVDAERVTRSNLRLWAHWLTEKATAAVIKAAKETKTPSAAKLGKHWRITIDEVAVLGLETITALAVTQEQDRTRQARRRRKAGAGTRRGRPKSKGLRPWQIAGASSKAAYYRSMKMAKASETENSHAPSYITAMKRDEFQSRSAERPSATAPALSETIETVGARVALEARPAPTPPRPIVIRLDAIPDDGLILDQDGNEFCPPPPYHRPPLDWMEVAMAGYRGRA